MESKENRVAGDVCRAKTLARKALFLCAMLLPTAALPFSLDLGVEDTARYGNRHGGVQAPIPLLFDFTLTNAGPATLRITGFDIDFADEVSISVDGGTLFFLARGVNGGYSSPELFDLGNLSAGPHTISIVNKVNNYIWSVSNLLVTQSGSSGTHAEGLLAELGCGVDETIRTTSTGWECVPFVIGQIGPPGVPGPPGPRGATGPAIDTVAMCFQQTGLTAGGASSCASTCAGAVVSGQTITVDPFTGPGSDQTASCQAISDNGDCSATASNAAGSALGARCCVCEP